MELITLWTDWLWLSITALLTLLVLFITVLGCVKPSTIREAPEEDVIVAPYTWFLPLCGRKEDTPDPLQDTHRQGLLITSALARVERWSFLLTLIPILMLLGYSFSGSFVDLVGMDKDSQAALLSLKTLICLACCVPIVLACMGAINARMQLGRAVPSLTLFQILIGLDYLGMGIMAFYGYMLWNSQGNDYLYALAALLVTGLHLLVHATFTVTLLATVIGIQSFTADGGVHTNNNNNNNNSKQRKKSSVADSPTATTTNTTSEDEDMESKDHSTVPPLPAFDPSREFVPEVED